MRNTAQNLQHDIQHKPYNRRHTSRYLLHTAYSKRQTTRHTAQDLKHTTYKILYELFIIRLKTRHTTQTYNMLHVYTTNTTRPATYKTYNNPYSTCDIHNETIPKKMTNTHEKESHFAKQRSFFRVYFYLLGLLLTVNIKLSVCYRIYKARRNQTFNGR